MSRGLIIAAPASGAGKTVVTLGILAALRAEGVAVRAAKSGPDYIDPRFHEAATGRGAVNLDAWAMPPERIRALAAGGDELLLIEGAMGLFDGAPPTGRGATADLARMLGLPVVLVVDCAAMGHSVAALVRGFAEHDGGVRVVGVILNRVGSERHLGMMRGALSGLAVEILGAIPRSAALTLPSRHLGLVQAGEIAGLAALIEQLAALMREHVALERLLSLAHPVPSPRAHAPLPPPGGRVAVARDAAFGFLYPHLMQDWRDAGAEILPFSPLADEGPDPLADAVFLPGGYPELHAGRLAAAPRFRALMRAAAARGARIHGECGGYMVLGQGLIDADGTRHEMLGLLPLETSFAERRLHLGYRMARPRQPFLGPLTPARLTGHEFHYATVVRAAGPELFALEDAEGRTLPPEGLVVGNVSGSFLHIIDRADRDHPLADGARAV